MPRCWLSAWSRSASNGRALSRLHRNRANRVGYDWKVGVVPETGAFEFQLAVSGGPDPDYRDGQPQDRTGRSA